MRHNIYRFFMVFFSVSALIACDKIVQESPATVLDSYLDATIKGKNKEAYSYISNEDKSELNIEEFSENYNEYYIPNLGEKYAKKITYKIINIEKIDNKAKANVNITFPDLRPMIFDLLGTAFKEAFSGGGGSDKDNEIEKMIIKKLDSGEILMTTQEKTFNLIKEADGWKIFLGLKNKRKIESLLAEAEELKKSKKLHGAVEKYEQILELDSEMIEAKEGVKETRKEIQSFQEKQDYIKNVVLYDLEARYYDTIFDEKVPGVEFKLKNNGNRTLREVEVTVYFKDKNGTIIAEEDYHPVLVSEYSFGNDNKPLKPNYVWQMERGKFYRASSVPDEWKEGSVSAKITDIEFEK